MKAIKIPQTLTQLRAVNYKDFNMIKSVVRPDVKQNSGMVKKQIMNRFGSKLAPGYVCRQVNEGIWKNQDDFSSPSSKHMGEDFRKVSDFDIPTSPPLNLNESSLANWSPHGHAHMHGHAHGNPSSGQRERDSHGVGSLKGRGLEELGGRGGADKVSSVEVRLVRAGLVNLIHLDSGFFKVK